MTTEHTLTAATQGSNSSLSTGVVGTKNMFLPWRNPDNVISFETFSLIEHVLFCYVNPVIFCIGVPANALNCIMFTRQGLQDRMNLCLFCLSAVDLLFVALFTLSGSHCWVALLRPDIAVWWKWSSHKHVLGLYRGFLLCSGCLTMIISVERCVCVFLPLKAASIVKTRSMGLLIAGTVVLIQLMCVTFPLKVDLKPVTDILTNLTDYQLVPSAMYAQQKKVFEIIGNNIVMNGIPLLSVGIVAVSTTITIMQLKRVIVWRKNASTTVSASNIQQVALVKMLVIVCSIFILTSCPFVALSITTLVEPEFFLNRRYTNIFLATHAIHLGLGMFNSSVNFFVYLFRSSRFRQELQAAVRMGGWFRKKGKAKSFNTRLVTDSSDIAGTEQPK